MLRGVVTVLMVVAILQPGFAQDTDTGVRGDHEAIADAEVMVDRMGGMEIWAQLKSVRFVHEWYPWHRVDAYIENEILDLTGPRSWVDMKSEIHYRVRAYSPEHRYWSVDDGVFSYGDDERLAAALERAPYSIYRIARAVAIGDARLEIRFGEGDIPGTRRLEFFGPDDEMHGWIILNARKEPLVWATTQYRYTFGPMKRFGNLSVPDWAVYENGITRYQMISLVGSNQQPDEELFMPPEEFRDTSPAD